MNYINLEAWDIRVTLDLFLGGIGVGAFLLSVLLTFYDRKSLQTRIKRVAIGFADAAPRAISMEWSLI